MGTTERNAFEILIWIDIGREKCAARHEMPRGAALRTKAHVLTLEIVERADRGVAGDEHRLELCVFLSLYQGNNISARPDIGLDKREPDEPGEINALDDP